MIRKASFVLAILATAPFLLAQATQQTADQAMRAKRLADEWKAKVGAVETDVNEARDKLRDLEDAVDAFERKRDDLLETDAGKQLGASEERFAEYRSIQKAPPVFSPEEIKARRRRMAQIAQIVSDAKSPSAPLPTPGEMDEVDKCKAWIGGKSQTVQDLDKKLSAILAVKEKLDPSVVSRLPTLKTRVDTANRMEIEERQRLKKEAEDAASPEANKKFQEAARTAFLEKKAEEAEELLRQEREESTRKQIESEQKIKRLEQEDRERAAEIEQKYQDKLAELERRVKDAEAKRRVEDLAAQTTREKQVAAADFERKKHQCHDPEVMHLLAPMLDKGYWQPGDGHDAYGRTIPSSIDPAPMSLGKIRAAGALARTRDGLAALYDIGENRHGQQDRQQKWGFKRFEDLSPEEFEELKRAQKYLIDLGDALVAEKMLEP